MRNSSSETDAGRTPAVESSGIDVANERVRDTVIGS